MTENVIITHSIADKKTTKEELNKNIESIYKESIQLRPKLEKLRERIKSEIKQTIKNYQEDYNLILLPLIASNDEIDIKLFCDLRNFKPETFLLREN